MLDHRNLVSSDLPYPSIAPVLTVSASCFGLLLFYRRFAKHVFSAQISFSVPDADDLAIP